MRFFISSYAKSNEDCNVSIYITNENLERVQLLERLREYFGPWMFLGVKEYSENEFFDKFKAYIPEYVNSAIANKPESFTYIAELNISY